MNAAVEISEDTRIHRAQDFQGALVGQGTAAVVEGIALVQQAQAVTHGSVGRPRNVAESFLFYLESFHLCHFPQAPLDHIR